MREAEPTGGYIWLRQAVTYTADGQTRTLEIAVPVPLGATAADVDALLAQASAGMAQLTRALDARVAATLAPSSSPLPAPAAPAESPVPQRPATAAAPVAPSEPEREGREVAPASTATVREPPSARPAPARPTAAAAPASSVVPPSTARPSPARPPASVPPTSAQEARPTPPARAQASAPLTSMPAASTPAASTPTTATGPALSRPEFLAAVGQLGLNPKEAMDKLGVRTLEGLNLREALESLRRQMLRGSPATPAAPTTPPAAPSTGSAGGSAGRPTPAPPARPAAPIPAATAPAATAPTPARAGSYFDEEDDADFTFTVDEEGAEEGALETDLGDEAAAEPEETLYEPDDNDLDDVPDFGPPPGRSSSPASASRARARAETAHPAPAGSAAAPTAAAGAPSPTATRAVELIAQMRSATPGGVASSQQRTAYRNIIVNELGEASARALVQSLWRVTPERLGPDQYDALISWGKQDTFADDVPLVLAALEAERRAERERAVGASGGRPEAGRSSAQSATSGAERGGSAHGNNGTASRASSSATPPATPPAALRPRTTKPGSGGTTRGEG